MIDLPVKIGYDLLTSEPKVSAIDFHMIEIPEGLIKKKKLPLGRINEIMSYDENHASNIPTAIAMALQIDVWADSIEDLNEYNKIIHELFIKDKWSCIASGIDEDPDYNETPRLYKRFRTNKNVTFNF